MTETLVLAIVLIPALVVAIVFHEVAHGYVAMLLGDTTAKEARRLSLNPLRHVDPIGTILVPGVLLASWIDYAKRKVPNWLNASLIVVGLLAAAALAWYSGLLLFG